MVEPTKLALKMAARIKEVAGLEVVPKIYRTRAGGSGRYAGAVSWYMVGPVGTSVWIGSQWTVKECLEAKFLEVDKGELHNEWHGDCFLIPSDEDF